MIIHACVDVMKLKLHYLIDKRQFVKSIIIIIHTGSVSWMQIKPKDGLNQKELINRWELFCTNTWCSIIQGYTNKVSVSVNIWPWKPYSHTKTLFVSFTHPYPVCQVWLRWIQLPWPHLPGHGGSTNYQIEHQSRQHWDKGEVSFKWIRGLLLALMKLRDNELTVCLMLMFLPRTWWSGTRPASAAPCWRCPTPWRTVWCAAGTTCSICGTTPSGLTAWTSTHQSARYKTERLKADTVSAFQNKAAHTGEHS